MTAIASRFENDFSSLIDVCGEPVFTEGVAFVHVCRAIAADVYVFEFRDGSCLLYEREMYTGYSANVCAYDTLSEVPDRDVEFVMTGTPDAEGEWRVARDDSGRVYVSFAERREYLDETVRWFEPDDEYGARCFAYQLELEED